MTDNPIKKFRDTLQNLPKPKEPPTEQQLKEGAQTNFSRLWQAVTKLDKAAKEAFDPGASIAYTFKNVDRRTGEIVGTISAVKPRGSLNGNANMAIDFLIRGQTINIEHSGFRAPNKTTQRGGGSYDFGDQEEIIKRLSDTLAEWFRTSA